MSLSFYLSAGFGGGYVTYFPSLARLLGSASAAILLGKLVFLQTKSVAQGGEPLSRSEATGRWVTWPLDAARFDTGLGLDELKAARRRLEKAGLLRTEYWRLTHELQWQIDFDALDRIGSDLSDCFNSKVEKPPSGTRENHSGQRGKTGVDNVNDVSIKEEAVARLAPAFSVASSSHPATAEALCHLANLNHAAKPDSNVMKTQQQIRQALAKAKGLFDEDAAEIINLVTQEGGWLSQTLPKLGSAAKVSAQKASLIPTPEDAHVAAAGSELTSMVGRRLILNNGVEALIQRIGVKVAGNLIPLAAISKGLKAGEYRLALP